MAWHDAIFRRRRSASRRSTVKGPLPFYDRSSWNRELPANFIIAIIIHIANLRLSSDRF